MSNRWPGGLIRKTPVTPAGPLRNGAAPGMWTLAEAAFWRKQGLWPLAENYAGWIGLLGGSGSDRGNSIAVDSSGNVYVCGYSNASGTDDFLLAKLPGDGSLTGTYSVGGYSFTYAASSLTSAASSLTSATSSLTDTASNLTDAASSLTDAATTLTSTVTTL